MSIENSRAIDSDSYAIDVVGRLLVSGSLSAKNVGMVGSVCVVGMYVLLMCKMRAQRTIRSGNAVFATSHVDIDAMDLRTNASLTMVA